MKFTVVVVVAATLVATVLVIASNERQARSTKPVARADQFWAEALLSKLSSTDGDDVCSRRNFAEALRRTDQKAPILVTLGDLASSLISAQTLSDSETAKHSRHIFVRKIDPIDIAESILRGVNDLQEASTAAYQSAVREDANCLVGWMRLTGAESEAVAGHAATELVQRDPDNAFCHYILAAFEQDAELLFRRIAAGNKAQRFSKYVPESPKLFHLQIPNTNEFRRLGIANMPLAPAALKNMLTMNIERGRPFWNSVDQTLRKACRRGFEYAEMLKNSGDVARATDRLTVLRDCGFRLISDEVDDPFLILLGINVINQSCNELHSLYDLTGDQENSEMMAENVRQLEIYRQSLRMQPPSEEETRSHLCGDLDYAVFSTERYRAARRIARLQR